MPVERTAAGEAPPRPKVSLVIPAYNEATRIEKGLARAHAWLVTQSWSFEVVLVDDGSTDRTAQIAARLGLVGVRVERIRANGGKGKAIRHGVARARGEVLITCDADFSTPVWEIPRVLEAFERGADVVIASREHPETRIPTDQHPVRKGMGRVFNRLVRLLTGLPFADTQCGFKGFRADVAIALYSQARIDGFATDVEILVLARSAGYRVEEIPVEWAHVADSRVRLLRHPIQMFSDLIEIALAARSARSR
jgi:dolichyl-phosphate beta-glucosyltransferase